MDPELGRFISMDPKMGSLSFSQTLNRYVYCINNPLRFTDPTGEGLFDWVEDNWKTIVVIAVCVAATVMIPGAGGIIAGALISGLVSGGVDAIDAMTKSGGDWKAVGMAFGTGFAVGFGTGLVGGAVGGRVITPLAKSLFTGEAKLALTAVASKVAGKVGTQLSKLSPSLGKSMSKASVSLGEKLNFGLVHERSLLSQVAKGKGDYFDFITGDIFKGSGLIDGLTTQSGRQGLSYVSAMSLGDEAVSLGVTSLASFYG